MARTEAGLTLCFLTQDFLAEHWDWSDDEKKQLGDIKAMSSIICDKIEKSCPNVKVSDCYAIKHDKDYKEVWDEVTLSLKKVYKSNHMHMLVVFSGGKPTLSQVASAVGLETSFIEPPKSGRYSKDNKLAYLIHAKDKEKHQYKPSEVVTYRGESYMSIYMTRKDAWEKSRAKKNSQNASESIDWLLEQILNGKITKSQIFLTDSYYATYAAYSIKCDAAFSTYGQRKAYQAIQAMENGEFTTVVLYITGKSGSGKSYFTDYFVNNLISNVYKHQGVMWQKCVVAASNPLDDWDGEEILVMDDLRGIAMGASDWLKLLDPDRAGRAGTRYRNKFVVPRVIIINAEKDVFEFFYFLKNIGGGDRSEAMDQFIRRIMNRVCVIYDASTDTRSVTIEGVEKLPVGQEQTRQLVVRNDNNGQRELATMTLSYAFRHEKALENLSIDDAVDYLTGVTMSKNHKF